MNNLSTIEKKERIMQWLLDNNICFPTYSEFEGRSIFLEPDYTFYVDYLSKETVVVSLEDNIVITQNEYDKFKNEQM